MSSRVFMSTGGTAMYRDTRLCRFIKGNYHNQLPMIEANKFSDNRGMASVIEMPSNKHRELEETLRRSLDHLDEDGRELADEALAECVNLNAECEKILFKFKKEGGMGNVIFCDEDRLAGCHDEV